MSFLPKTLESIPTNIEVTKAKSITDKSQSSFQVNPAAGVLATPAVRRVSRENNVTLSNVLGSGKEGRILKEDVMQFIKNGLQPTNSTSSSSSAPIPLSKFQKSMFRQMTKSLAIPHFGYSEEITIDNCQKIRNDINKNLASNPYKSVSKITNMSIYVKAMSLSLLDFPILNSSIVGDETNVMLQYHANHNIGIAMDTINGFVNLI